MFCTNCGKEIPNTSNFCKYCGNKVNKNTNENTSLQNQEQTNQQQSQIPKTVKAIFHRIKKFTGSVMPLDIYIDKKLIGSLYNNATFEINIPCGTHSIILDMCGSTYEKQITFSEEYSTVYLDLEMKMGVWTNKPQIVSIKNEK